MHGPQYASNLSVAYVFVVLILQGSPPDQNDMLRLHSTGHSLASSARQQGTHSLHRPANKTLIQCRSASSSRDGAGTAVTSTAAQTAPTACAAAAVAAGVLLGSWLQPAAALALPQQELEEIRQAIEKDFSEGAAKRSTLIGSGLTVCYMSMAASRVVAVQGSKAS